VPPLEVVGGFVNPLGGIYALAKGANIKLAKTNKVINLFIDSLFFLF
jgi:hypothetical protein